MGSFFERMLEPVLKVPFICSSDAGMDNRAVTTPNTLVARWQIRGLIAALCCALLVLGAVGPQPAWGGDRGDHERARAAVRTGEILPLATLLERLQRTHPGQVLELELEREDGRWIYEIKLLQADGQLLKLALDARTAQVLEVKRKGRSDSGRVQGPSR